MSEQDLQKLAGDTRQRIIREFAEKHATFRERTRRVPLDEAKRIAEETHSPLQIATVAYLINLDGIMSIRSAVELLANEMQRRTVVGEGVPNIPGNIMEFAIGEGQWIEHIHGVFSRELELKVRELANIEMALEDAIYTTEQSMAVLSARTRMAETYIQPILETWLKEHPKANGEDVLNAFGPPVTKWRRSTLMGKAAQARRRNEAFFRRVLTGLEKASDSATIDSTVKRVITIIEGLEADFKVMDTRALAHFLLHIIPRPTGRGDKSSFVDVGSGSTRGYKAEPDMQSPFDFLERDVLLSRRRPAEERLRYLGEKIARVIRVLKYQGLNTEDSIARCIEEISARLKIEGVTGPDTLETLKKQIEQATADERDDTAVRLIYNFVETHYYGRQNP
ncbi:MAG: hypothetical protein HXY34_03900 [Candidatus Thorarchaeota archaeon]|nr:hypothetical protein [Candidatus Thorarchaeota archaeon]